MSDADGQQQARIAIVGSGPSGFYAVAQLLKAGFAVDLYDLLRSQTGSHSQTARQLRVNRISLYKRLERARRRRGLSTVNEALASVV